MKYYYMDSDEINIRTKIRNLTSISANILKKTGKVIVSCSNESGEVISSSNSSKHFELFLATLARTYNSEKDSRNIIILNDDVYKILEGATNSKYPDYFKDHMTYPFQNIDYPKFDITSLTPLIHELISVIFGIEGLEITNFSKLSGTRHKFISIVSTKTKECVIPIKFHKIDDLNYEISFGNMYGSKSVKAYISFTDTNLYVLFKAEGINIVGSLKYTIGDEVTEQVEVIYNDTPIMIKTFIMEESKDKDLKDKFPRHKIFRLPNDLYVAVLIDGDYRDIHYISMNNLSNKDRNISVRSVDIDGISCPITTVKRIEEEFPIQEGLSIVQEYFLDIPEEDEYYRELLANRVLFKVICDGKEYYPIESDQVDCIKTLDGEIIRLALEGKNR